MSLSDDRVHWLERLETDVYRRLLAAHREILKVKKSFGYGGEYLAGLGARGALIQLLAAHLNVTEDRIRRVLELDNGEYPVTWLRQELRKPEEV